MSNKLVKFNKQITGDYRMEKVANKVMKEANDYTSWGFSVIPQEDAYLVGTSISRYDGQVMNIVFKIRKVGVEISTFIPECRYDEKFVQEVLGELSFPVEAKGTNGEILIVKSMITFELLESDTVMIVREMMAVMVVAMMKILAEKR